MHKLYKNALQRCCRRLSKWSGLNKLVLKHIIQFHQTELYKNGEKILAYLFFRQKDKRNGDISYTLEFQRQNIHKGRYLNSYYFSHFYF